MLNRCNHFKPKKQNTDKYSPVKFTTIDGRHNYYVYPKKHLIDWNGKSPSKFQRDIKLFFWEIWDGDIVGEEVPCHPLIKENYRFDLLNFTRKICVECNHSQHIRQNNFFHPTHQDFWDAQERDRKKEILLEDNGYSLIMIYPETELTYEWLTKKYPKLDWPEWMTA